MDLGAQVRGRLSAAFAQRSWPVCSRDQFERLVQAITALVQDAEEGRLRAEREGVPEYVRVERLPQFPFEQPPWVRDDHPFEPGVATD